MTRSAFPIRQAVALTVLGTLVSGCNAVERLSNIGKAPDMAQISNPVEDPSYRPVTMPMPTPVAASRRANSLWQEGSRAFFKDQRASDVGDIITVVVTIDDSAEMDNETTRTRSNTDTAGLRGLFGIENTLDNLLPGTVGTEGNNLVDLGSTLSNVGNGEIEREETVNLRVAAVVTQKLPNGNMVLFGRQEVRVNFEVREVVVGGVIRAADITTTNTISYDQMAEARIAYGGRGQLTDIQQPRYGSQVLDIIMPF